MKPTNELSLTIKTAEAEEIIKSGRSRQREILERILEVREALKTMTDSLNAEAVAAEDEKTSSKNLRMLQMHQLEHKHTWAGVNLSGKNLKGLDLSGMNLHGANLSGCNLTGCNLERTDLNGANLSNTKLTGVKLRLANLKNTDLSGSNISIESKIMDIALNTEGMIITGTPLEHQLKNK